MKESFCLVASGDDGEVYPPKNYMIERCPRKISLEHLQRLKKTSRDANPLKLCRRAIAAHKKISPLRILPSKMNERKNNETEHAILIKKVKYDKLRLA